MTHTDIMRCSVVELVAIDRAVKTPYHRTLLSGRRPWTGTARQRALLERLRDVRGLLVIEGHVAHDHVTICGSLTPDGFARRV